MSKKKATPTKTGGAMTDMRGGFKGLLGLGQKKKGKPDPKEFLWITVSLFLIFLLIFILRSW